MTIVRVDRHVRQVRCKSIIGIERKKWKNCCGQADLETIMWDMGSEGGLEKPCGYGLFGAGLEEQGGAGLQSFSLRPPTKERLCEEALGSLHVQGGLYFCPGH